MLATPRRFALGTKRTSGSRSRRGRLNLEAVPGTSTVWSIFPGDTGYWPLEQQVMVNFRVDDLDAMRA